MKKKVVKENKKKVNANLIQNLGSSFIGKLVSLRGGGRSMIRLSLLSQLLLLLVLHGRLLVSKSRVMILVVMMVLDWQVMMMDRHRHHMRRRRRRDDLDRHMERDRRRRVDVDLTHRHRRRCRPRCGCGPRCGCAATAIGWDELGGLGVQPAKRDVPGQRWIWCRIGRWGFPLGHFNLVCRGFRGGGRKRNLLE